MNIYYLFKFMRLWGIFACITLLFSVLVIVSCNNIFKISNKKEPIPAAKPPFTGPSKKAASKQAAFPKCTIVFVPIKTGICT